MLNKYPAYFSYNKENQEWSIVEPLSSVTGKTSDIDIVLDNSFFPHAAWDENRTAYSFFDGNIWSENEIVDLSYAKTVEVSVDINGNPIIITTEDLNNIELACYFKDNSEVWQRRIVDSGVNTIFTPNLIVKDDIAFVVYQKSFSPTDSDIYVCRTDLELILNDLPENELGDVFLYPNPFYNELSILLKGCQPEDIEVIICDITGVLINRFIIKSSSEFEMDNYCLWDGCDSDGKMVTNGIYFIILNGKTSFWKKIIKL